MALQILQQADALVAVSGAVGEELLRYGFSSERIFHIPNGVDTTYFRRRSRFPGRERTRFILISRRHPQKGIDTALQAARLLKDRSFSGRFEVHMYGTDYPEYDYSAMAREMGVEDAVTFHPFIEDIYPVYESAHCFLLPSRGEGMSNSLLEAMAMELPAIVTPVSGSSDVVEEGKNGFFVPADASDRLASAMAEIISKPALAERLGQNARRKVETGLSLETVVRRYSQLYERLHAAGER
jgi:glycosyltransferase involved in cell wall biosynthesis